MSATYLMKMRNLMVLSFAMTAGIGMTIAQFFGIAPEFSFFPAAPESKPQPKSKGFLERFALLILETVSEDVEVVPPPTLTWVPDYARPYVSQVDAFCRTEVGGVLISGLGMIFLMRIIAKIGQAIGLVGKPQSELNHVMIMKVKDIMTAHIEKAELFMAEMQRSRKANELQSGHVGENNDKRFTALEDHLLCLNGTIKDVMVDGGIMDTQKVILTKFQQFENVFRRLVSARRNVAAAAAAVGQAEMAPGAAVAALITPKTEGEEFESQKDGVPMEDSMPPLEVAA